MKTRGHLATFLFRVITLVAHGKPCPPFKGYGLIAQRWADYGAANGYLGCLLSDELPRPGSRARHDNFENGQVVWSPDQGPNMVVSAYWKLVPGNPPVRRTLLEWEDAAPFHYDFYLVRPNALPEGSDNHPRSRSVSHEGPKQLSTWRWERWQAARNSACTARSPC